MPRTLAAVARTALRNPLGIGCIRHIEARGALFGSQGTAVTANRKFDGINGSRGIFYAYPMISQRLQALSYPPSCVDVAPDHVSEYQNE
jgi:hypothetical protein